MTQTIIVSSASMEANPLYAKLRSKFANPIDHRTVGEAKVQQAIRLALDYTPVLGVELASYQGYSAAGFYGRGLANLALSATYCF